MVEKTIGNKKDDSVTVNYTLADSCDDTTVVGATSSVSWLSATVSAPSNHAGTITITATEDGTDVTRYAFITPSINGEPCDNNRIKITQQPGEQPEPEPCKWFIVDGGSWENVPAEGASACDSAFLYNEGVPVFIPSTGSEWVTPRFTHWDEDPHTYQYFCSIYDQSPCVAESMMRHAGITPNQKPEMCGGDPGVPMPQLVMDTINGSTEYTHALGTVWYDVARNTTGEERSCTIKWYVDDVECESAEYKITQLAEDTPSTCESCSDFGITDRADYPVPATGYTYANPVKELKTNCDPDGQFTVEHKSDYNILISMAIGRQGAKSYLITGTAGENPSTTTELTEVLSIKYNGVECATTTITQKKSGDVPVPCDDPCESLNINLPVSSEGIRTITATSEAGNASFTYKCCQDLYVRKGSSTANWITVSKSYDSSTSAGTVSITYDANTTTSTRDCAILFSIEEGGQPCNDQLKIPIFKQDGRESGSGAKVTIHNNTTGKTSPKIGFYNTNGAQVGGVVRYNPGETNTSITWSNVSVPINKIDYTENNAPIKYISIYTQIVGQPPVNVLAKSEMGGTTGTINLTRTFNPADFDDGNNIISITFTDE